MILFIFIVSIVLIGVWIIIGCHILEMIHRHETAASKSEAKPVLETKSILEISDPSKYEAYGWMKEPDKATADILTR